MGKIIHKWRYYTLEQEQYNQCMTIIFPHNLYYLRLANAILAALTFCFMCFPLYVEKNIYKASFYLLAIFIALLLTAYANHEYRLYKQGKLIKNLNVYIMTTLYYINITIFGIYIGVWTSRNGTATTFMSLLICALFLYIHPPLYNLLLTLSATVLFIIASVALKARDIWIYDISNALLAGIISIIFTWVVSMLRIVAAVNESKLEEERNSYYDQSTIDELTQLKNRRHFMHTFQRRLTHYRSSDDWQCIALMDIDFFKSYNDFYGHPQGDECLRAIGKAMNGLRDSIGIYVARVGGEEFALLWYEKDTNQINNTVSRVQQAINELNIPHEKSDIASHITVSIGIHTLRCGTSHDMDVLYDYADKALYTAKRSGRNRAVIYDTQKA